MKVRLLDVAQQELDEVVEYYNAESPGLGDESCSKRLRRSPEFKIFQTLGIRIRKIRDVVRRVGFLTALLIKYWSRRYWLSPSRTCIDDLATGEIGSPKLRKRYDRCN